MLEYRICSYNPLPQKPFTVNPPSDNVALSLRNSKQNTLRRNSAFQTEYSLGSLSLVGLIDRVVISLTCLAKPIMV